MKTNTQNDKKVFDFNTFKWSYSSLSMFDQCPKLFKLCYIDKFEREDSAFTQFGKLIHSILERYYKKELEIFELFDVFESEYLEKVTKSFPILFSRDLEMIYYNAAKKYFKSFDDPFFDYEIVSIEKEFETEIYDISIKGFIDLILKDDKENYIIVDHKSKSHFKSKKEAKEYFKQLYIYSKHIIDEYERIPKTLYFNLIRNTNNENLVSAEFDKTEYNNTLIWVKDIAQQAKNTKVFEDKIKLNYEKLGKEISEYTAGSDFFCSQLCSLRKICERSDAF